MTDAERAAIRETRAGDPNRSWLLAYAGSGQSQSYGLRRPLRDPVSGTLIFYGLEPRS